MTIACQIVDVAPPPLPNITAIDMVLSCSTCIVIGTISELFVDVTWENQGVGTGSFYPAINWSSGGVEIGRMTYPITFTVDPGKRTTQRFRIELPVGTYEICPDPN